MRWWQKALRREEAPPSLTVVTTPSRSISESWPHPSHRAPQRGATPSLTLTLFPKAALWGLSSPRGLPGGGAFSQDPSHRSGVQRPLLFLWQRGGFESSTTAERDLLRNLGARRSSRWASMNVSVSSFFHCTNSGSLWGQTHGGEELGQCRGSADQVEASGQSRWPRNPIGKAHSMSLPQASEEGGSHTETPPGAPCSEEGRRPSEEPHTAPLGDLLPWLCRAITCDLWCLTTT